MCATFGTLEQRGLPVWAKAISAQGTVKETSGSVNAPFVCGGQTIEAGDVVIAYDDDVCVVRHADAAAALENAEQRIAKEEQKRQRLASGELGLDIYDMRGKLAERGLKYV